MDKESQKITPRQRLSREETDRSAEKMNHQTAGSRNDGRTGPTKRKAGPDQTPRKRARGSKPDHQKKPQEDLRVRVLKRKVRDDGEGQTKGKKKRRLDDSQEEPSSSQESASSSMDNEGASSSNMDDTDQTSSKRKAAGEGPKRKRRRNGSPAPKKMKKSEIVAAQRSEFEAKYEEGRQLGAGGCGSVFAGYRRADNVPVAIKHIPKEKVPCKHRDKVSIEVAIMLKLGATDSVGTSAPVSLLDWYDLGKELILVLERPVPCRDLFDYVRAKGGTLQEHEAKIIMKQLVDAVKELEDKSIFHRDIKPENVLIESSSDVPRVRIIDFGLGCFVKKGAFFRTFYGTIDHVPPEWYQRCTYRPGPTTVWQMGVVLYESLHGRSFSTMPFLNDNLTFNRELSKDCKDFLMSCLREVPENRPTLKQLQRHPWLR